MVIDFDTICIVRLRAGQTMSAIDHPVTVGERHSVLYEYYSNGSV